MNRILKSQLQAAQPSPEDDTEFTVVAHIADALAPFVVTTAQRSKCDIHQALSEIDRQYQLNLLHDHNDQLQQVFAQYQARWQELILQLFDTQDFLLKHVGWNPAGELVSDFTSSLLASREVARYRVAIVGGSDNEIVWPEESNSETTQSTSPARSVAEIATDSS